MQHSRVNIFSSHLTHNNTFVPRRRILEHTLIISIKNITECTAAPYATSTRIEKINFLCRPQEDTMIENFRGKDMLGVLCVDCGFNALATERLTLYLLQNETTISSATFFGNETTSLTNSSVIKNE